MYSACRIPTCFSAFNLLNRGEDPSVNGTCYSPPCSSSLYICIKKTLRNRSALSQPEIMKPWNQEVERIIAMRPVSGRDGNLEWDNRENIRERQ